MVRIVLLSLIVVGLACRIPAFATDAHAPPKLPPLVTLNGTWRADVSDSQAVVLKINDNRIEMTAIIEDRAGLMWSGRLRISPAKPNRHMDWVELKSGNSKLPDNKCLYRLRGDTLLVIGGGPDQRPTRFLSGAGTSPKTLVFIRDTARQGAYQ